MTNFTVNKFYEIDDLILRVKNKEDREAVYMIYIEKDNDSLDPGMKLYVGDAPGFDDDDNEILPENVISLGLCIGYMREHFQDVVDLAYRQKPTASTAEVIQCLNHFAQYDDFLDLL